MSRIAFFADCRLNQSQSLLDFVESTVAGNRLPSLRAGECPVGSGMRVLLFIQEA